MIELNILRTRLDRFRKQQIVLNLFIIYFAGLAFLLLLLAMTFLGNKLYISRIENDIRTIEEKIAAEQKTVEYIKIREKESERLLKRMSVFAEEYEKRILWAPLLAFTGQNVPAGIWLEDFSVKPASSAPKEKKDTVTVTITGYLLPGMVNERVVIDRFVRDLSRGNVFAGVYLKEVRKKEREGMETVVFDIECELKNKRGVSDVAEASD